MKKILFTLVGIVLLTFMLSACSINGSFKDEPNLTFKTGILYEKPSDGGYLGTHVLLEEDSEEFIPVRSLSINLSSEMYLENKVELIGFENPDDGVFEATGVSVKEVLNPVEDKDPEFVTYKNSDFGVELKYYDDWELKEEDSKITFSHDGAEIVIYQDSFQYEPQVDEDGNEVSALQAYADNKFASDGSYVYTPLKIGANSLTAVGYYNSYYLYRSGFIYTIGMSYLDDLRSPEEEEAYDRIYNEMISEFKFIGYTVKEDGETGDDEVVESDSPITSLPEIETEFSSFESFPYNFSMNYPKNWYYAGSNTGESGVMYHYGFSDESVEDGNEILMLDIISTDLPSGTPIVFGGFKAVRSGGVLYTSVDGHNFKLSGDSEYENLMIHMLNSIEPISEE